MTLGELVAEAGRLSGKIDAGVQHLAAAAKKAAQAEMDYRQAKSVAWLQAREGTVPERQAHVDAAVSDKRFARDLADGERVAALEALRSRRAQLSALQSISAAWRAEAEHAKFGPEVGP
jgi:hypothetical protein